MIVVLVVLLVFELIVNMAKKRFWPSIVDVWQEIEQEGGFKNNDREY